MTLSLRALLTIYFQNDTNIVHEQERKRFEKHVPSPYDDVTIAKENLAKHMEWVLHGDNKPADPEENTYPLPHNAYSQRPLANKEQQNQSVNSTNDDDDDSTNNKPTDHNTSSSSTSEESQNKSTNQSSHLTQADTKNANTRANVSITESEIDAFFKK